MLAGVGSTRLAGRRKLMSEAQDNPKQEPPAPGDDTGRRHPLIAAAIVAAVIALIVGLTVMGRISRAPGTRTPDPDVLSSIAATTDCGELHGWLNEDLEAVGTMDPNDPDWAVGEATIDALQARLDALGCP